MAVMLGDPQGINAWYLNRQGRQDVNEDDEPPTQAPDMWLDQVTGPAAPLGRRAVARPEGHSPHVHPESATGEKEPPESRPRAADKRRRSAPPQGPIVFTEDLVRAARQMNRKAGRSLPQKEVVAKLRAAGWKVSKGELKRALKAAGASRQHTSTKALRRQSSTKAPDAPHERTGPIKRNRTAGAIREVGILQAQFPDIPMSESVRRLQANGLHFSEAEVIAILGKSRVQVTSRRTPPPRTQQPKSNPSAVPTTRVTANIPSKPPPHSERVPAGVCQSCGIAVSVNGYCGCS